MFSWPQSEKDWSRYRLREEQTIFFNRNGYLSNVKLLENWQVDQLREEKAVRFWHDQLFCKPAKHGGVVAWHQDYSYWIRTSPMQHLTTWIGLDDASRDNGCLQYIPESHTWGLLDKPVLTGEMERGYASFHHPLLVHGSFENLSDRPRRACVLNVFADGTLSDSDEEILVGVPKIAKGNKIEGQFFPLLYPMD